MQSRLRQLSSVTARALFAHGRQLLMSAFLWKPLRSRLLSAPFYTSGNRSSERLSVLSGATPRVRTAAWQPGPRPHSFLFCGRAAGRGTSPAGHKGSTAFGSVVVASWLGAPRHVGSQFPHISCIGRQTPGKPPDSLTFNHQAINGSHIPERSVTGRQGKPLGRSLGCAGPGGHAPGGQQGAPSRLWCPQVSRGQERVPLWAASASTARRGALEGTQLCAHPSLQILNRLLLVFLASHQLRQLHEPLGPHTLGRGPARALQPGGWGLGHTTPLVWTLGFPRGETEGPGSVTLWFLRLQGAPGFLR